MKFSDGEIARRLRLGEDGGWEFKEITFAGDRPRGPRRDDLADEIAAFANTAGLTGRLNPIRDPHDRICLYASNVIINEGEPQPVYCLPEDELRLTDAGGREMLVRIAVVAGRSALVTYRPVEL